MSNIIKIREDKKIANCSRICFFVGFKNKTLQFAGDIVLYPEERDIIIEALKIGAQKSKGTFIFDLQPEKERT